MEIYLVRHTTPDVLKGTCYGQADLEVTGSFHSEAEVIRQHLPASVNTVYSSPLKRCRQLAEYLYGAQSIHLRDELMEINCGRWELLLWDDIPSAEIDAWKNDFVNVSTGDGESYSDLHRRVSRVFENIHNDELPAVIVAHGGVIRSILSHITGTALIESFKVFSLRYGCVIKLVKTADQWQYEILSNPDHEMEIHKPSNF